MEITPLALFRTSENSFDFSYHILYRQEFHLLYNLIMK